MGNDNEVLIVIVAIANLFFVFGILWFLDSFVKEFHYFGDSIRDIACAMRGERLPKNGNGKEIKGNSTQASANTGDTDKKEKESV